VSTQTTEQRVRPGMTLEQFEKEAERVCVLVTEGIGKLEVAEKLVEELDAAQDPGHMEFARWGWPVKTATEALLLGFPGRGSDFSHPEALVEDAVNYVALVRGAALTSQK
jgi:hypothetical protein